MISFDDFAKMDLRVGKVVEVREHPSADKLYVLKVDMGENQIQLVAGLKVYYSPEELEGKLIVVLTNLEPKTLRGVESQGMLLAASAGDTVSVLTVDKEVPPGSTVK